MRSASPSAFSCRLCDSRELELYFSQGNDGRFKYYKCGHCGLVNLDLAQGLDQSQYTDELEDPEDEHGRSNRQIDRSFDFLCQHVSEVRSFCDIGSGNGRFLLLGKRAGWRVLGIELSEDVAAASARRLGVEVIAGNFLDLTPSAEHVGAFDVVSLRHVLEHLPDSKRAMRKIRAYLRPEGYALFEMPNIEGLEKRLKRAVVNAGWHERKYRDDFVAGHCNEFCRESFEYLLKETGFRLLRWETYSNQRMWNWLINRVPIGTKARALVQAAS